LENKNETKGHKNPQTYYNTYQQSGQHVSNSYGADPRTINSTLRHPAPVLSTNLCPELLKRWCLNGHRRGFWVSPSLR